MDGFKLAEDRVQSWDFVNTIMNLLGP